MAIIVLSTYTAFVLTIFLFFFIKERIEKNKRQRLINSPNFVELFTSKELNEFFNIPEEFRCNPYLHNTEGKMFYADIRNIEKLERHLENKAEIK